MAKKKDPAVLFYTRDFLAGTMLMTDAQKGKYITLLCLQHLQGHLTEEDMLGVCGKHDPKIFSKFIKDEDGLYYNERMEEEVQTRKKYSESRANNRRKKEEDTQTYVEDTGNICSTYEEHMANANTNANAFAFANIYTGNDSRYIIFIPPTREEVYAYCSEKNYKIDVDEFIDFYTSKGWLIGKTKMKDWKAAVRNWARRSEPKQTASQQSTRAFFDTLDDIIVQEGRREQ